MEKMAGRLMIRRVCALLLLVALFNGCANTRRMSKKDLFFQKWKEKAEATQSYSPVSKPRVLTQQREEAKERNKSIYAGEQPLLPLKEKRETAADLEKKQERALPTDPVSLSMNDVELGTLLRTLAKAVDLNLMVNQSVKGKANINIHQSPWDQVFKGLLATHSLTYAWEGDILRVITKEDFESDLKLMEAKLKKLSLEKDKQGELNALEAQTKLSEPLETRVFHVNYTDPKKLKENLAAFLLSTHTDITEEEAKAQPARPDEGTVAGEDSAPAPKNPPQGQPQANPPTPRVDKASLVRGTILVDEHTNSIIVQAPTSDMARMIPLIEALDRPTRQVRIEAHIVEASEGVARQLGIQWGGLYHNASSGRNYWIGPGQQYDGGDTTPPAINNPWNPGYGVNFPVNPTDMVWQGFSVGYMAEALGDYLLALQLSALQEDGLLNILSSPSITTLDNKKAVIESGKDIPFQTVEEGEVNIEWRKATLRLEVTPHIIDDQLLNLEILTHKDEVDFTEQVNGNPTIIIKHAESNVVMFDKQTTVIAGLKKDRVSRGEAGAPWLKDIPGLGYLFGSKSHDDELEEMLIFITPFILEERTEPPPPEPVEGPPRPAVEPEAPDVG